MSSRSTTPDNPQSDPTEITRTPTKHSTIAESDLQNPGKDEPPSTLRKKDFKRRYGVRITDDEPSMADASDSLDDSEAELRRVQHDISHADTTNGDLSVNDSGAGGARSAISRRSAAGISLKDSEARIKKLEFENSELRIECDLWRHQMRSDEARMKIVTISKELTKQRRNNVEYMRLLKEQDSSIKESRRILKRWGDLDPKEEVSKRQDLEKKLEEALAMVESERQERERLEEELEEVRNTSVGEKSLADNTQVLQLRQLLNDQRDDHAEEVYSLQRERDDLQAQIDDLQGQASRGTSATEKDDVRAEAARLEAENDSLTTRIDELQQIRSKQETELEDLRSELQQVQAAEDSRSRELEVAHRRLEHLAADQEDGEEKSRMAEAVLSDKFTAQIDRLRDELAEAKLDLSKKDQQLDELERLRDDDDVRLQELELELERAANAIEERNEEIDKLGEEADELEVELQKTKKVLEEADEEVKELSDTLELRIAEVTEANRELQEISQKLMDSEDDNEALRQDVQALETEAQTLNDQLQELRERSERRENAYKERLGHAEQIKVDIQSQLDAIEKDYQNAAEESRVLGRDVDSMQQEKKDLQQELEKVYAKLDDAIEDLKEEEKRREMLEEEMERKLESEEAKWTQLVDEKEDTIAGIEKEIESLRESLAISKGDVAKLHDALRDKENESVRLGQTHSSDRYSLELEIDRLKRDLGRCEADLDRARKDLDRKEEALRDKEGRLNDLHYEIREMSSKLAVENQTKLGLEERIEAQNKHMGDAQRQVDEYRAKMDELEREANMGERSLMQAEAGVKTQLTERNTLLLTIYQYMGKILGNSTPRKRGEGDLKPFTNFAVFHDSLISRLRKVSDIQVQFDQKSKAIEDKFVEKFAALKRQQESRFRQIDRFELAIKNATDKQSQWRTKLLTKQGEMDAMKSTNAELQTQIASLKTRSNLSSPADASKINALTARANNAERRLNAAQNQSQIAEERLTDAKGKYAEGEGKWAARIKELESRCKAAEERVKRERQGAKERVAELEDELQRMRKTLEGERKRVKGLENIQAT